jgi:hypothetical protein
VDPCPKCGDVEHLDGVRLGPINVGGVEDVQAVVAPTSGMLRPETASDLRARVCASCGFTELSVTDPAVLAERWRAGER